MFKKLFRSSKSSSKANIDFSNLPKHIAIIMDGNGRWARSKNLPRVAGHKAGVEALRDIIKTSSNLGIKYLTLYAFSTENWKRPREEINALMELLVIYLRREAKELHKNNVVINVLGDISKLPETAISEINKATALTSNNTGLVVNIALNYGGRHEILRAVKNICKDVVNNKIDFDKIDEAVFSNYLYTKNIPDPDLIIRTSGEIRLSNFLLWQAAYSEFWFTDVYWPDFSSKHFIEAIIDYQSRKRRFGGIK
ncbi:Undecaprenyl pyrophosphate synthetase [Caminicella sporogenes DSM 14501]|uniref:Isoprenyl transferase n=1 Tax=Caminicella sporogenes DSM 14501 TaxID=1121266 RepID=A0A1M6L957_9FIRM|nr:isoprenyl transferase [Caminicella sporogenes]WIF94672.1 isoprenyl transferase [Caminicella sporogenes]SHJ67768.1 Undecaprenyl pyrophosphate synthetase [Caminicella sporogenes DSM 14501]